MSVHRAQELKEAGNEALNRKDYDKAISLYTRAIELDNDNPKLYSNRCTAYLHLRNYEKAIIDAKKCASLDPDWGKAHVQMGSCLVGLHKYQEAVEEYKKALPLVDNASVIQGLIKGTEAKMQQSSLRYILFGDSLRSMITLENILRIAMILCSCFVILPIWKRMAARCASLFSTFLLCIVLIHLYETFGRPRFSMEYVATIMRDSLACYLIPYGIFMNTPFVSMVMIMIDFSQILPLCSFIYSQVLQTHFPSAAEKIRRSFDGAMGHALGSDQWLSRTPTEKQYILSQIVEMSTASLELSLLIPGLLNIRSGMRGVLMLVLLVQYLMFRTSTNSSLARTVQQFDVSLNQLVYRPGCPEFIRTIYLKLRGIVIRMYNSSLRRFFVCYIRSYGITSILMPVIVQRIRKRAVRVPKRPLKKRHWILTIVFILLAFIPFVYIWASSKYNLSNGQNSDFIYWIIREIQNSTTPLPEVN